MGTSLAQMNTNEILKSQMHFLVFNLSYDKQDK